MAAPVRIDPVDRNSYNWDKQYIFQSLAGDYYAILACDNALGIRATRIFKSTDQGVTWAVMDDANSPANFSHAVLAEIAANRIIICYKAVIATDSELRFQTFDLLTDTWSAAYGEVAAPIGRVMEFAWRLAGGDIGVIYRKTLAGMGFRYDVFATRFDPATNTWKNSLNLTAHRAEPGDIWANRMYAESMTVADENNGRIHLIYETAVAGGDHYYYRNIVENGALDLLATVQDELIDDSGIPGIARFQGAHPFGAGVVTAMGEVMFPYKGIDVAHGISVGAMVLKGIPLAAPVWTYDVNGVDAAIWTDSGFGPDYPNLFIDSLGRLHYLFTCDFPPVVNAWWGVYHVRSDDNGLTWNPHELVWTVTEDAVLPGVAGQYLYYPTGLWDAANGILATATIARIDDPFGGTFGMGYYAGLGGAPPGPAAPAAPAPLSLGQPLHGCQLKPDVTPNWCDLALYSEYDLWESVIRGEFQRLDPQKSWVRQPPEAKRIHKVGVLPLPPDDGLDHLVLEFRVPTNCGGVITHLVAAYTGSGYVPMSGDLVWRMRVNEWWVKDYATLLYPLGTVRTPLPMVEGGLRLRPNQIWRFYGVVSPGAMGVLLGGSLVWAAIGWFHTLPIEEVVSDDIYDELFSH